MLPKNRPISIWLLWRVQWKLNLISMKNSKFFFNCLKSQLSDPFGCCKKVVEARFASEVAFLNSTPHENLPPLENSKKKWVWQNGTRGKTETILEKDFQGDICHICRSGCDLWFDLRVSLLAPKMTCFPHILQKWSTWLYIFHLEAFIKEELCTKALKHWWYYTKALNRITEYI